MSKTKTERAATNSVDEPNYETTGAMFSPRLWLGGTAALFWLVYTLGLNRVFGLLVDDAWYLMLAKSLATGQGYQLINSPSPGILPLFPPGWPFLLSLAYRVFPNFPANVPYLKLLSVLSVFLSAGLTYLFFVKCRAWRWPLALMMAALVAFQTEFFTMATTTLMSECCFTVFLMLLVYLVERADQQFAQVSGVQVSGVQVSSWAWGYVVAAALAGAGLFFVRSMGIAVLAGVFFWWLRQRQGRQALVFTALIAALVLPWMLYARAHAPTLSQRAEQQGNIVTNYAQAFWQKRAGSEFTGEVTLLDLPGRVAENAFSIATSDLGGILIPTIYAAVSEKNEGLANLFAFALCLIVLLGVWCVMRERVTVVEFIFAPSLLMILLWGWQPFRFLIPYTAFLFYYLAEGLRRLLRYQYRAMHRAKEVKPFALETKWLTYALGLFLALFLLDITAFLFIPTTAEGTRKAYYAKRFSEIEGALQWVRDSLSNDGAITTPNPALVHLYSGRKTVSFNEPEKRWEVWKKLNVRYLALVYGLNPLPPLTRNEKNFQVIYQHPGQLNLRVIDFGVASNRTDWQASQKSESIDLRIK